MDDHSKNFSFLMGDDGVWHIAPAYDFTFSIIERAVGVVSNYDHYAGLAGVSGYWRHQIKEETSYRIENMSDLSHHRGLGR